MRADNSRGRTPVRSLREQGAIHIAPAFLAFAAIFSAFLSSAWAGTLVDFTPTPASPGAYEVIWNQSQLYEGPGAVGTNFRLPGIGDGNLPVTQQFAPGLSIETPYVVQNSPGSNLPGGFVNLSNDSTTFYDASLLIIPSAPTSGACRPSSPRRLPIWHRNGRLLAIAGIGSVRNLDHPAGPWGGVGSPLGRNNQ